MSKSKAATKRRTAEPDDREASPAPQELEPAEAPPKRIARHVQPLGPRVLVRIVEAPSRLDSGLYLPANAKDETIDALLGQVLEVARTMPTRDNVEFQADVDDDDTPRGSLGENVSGIPLGARVLFGKERGVTIPWDETLRLVDTRHVLALVDEISEDKLQ